MDFCIYYVLGEGFLSQDGIIAMSSSLAAVFILTSIVLFAGCLCRQFCCKKKRLIETLPPAITYRKQLPHYDDVQFPPKREVSMKPNESYHSRWWLILVQLLYNNIIIIVIIIMYSSVSVLTIYPPSPHGEGWRFVG